MISEKDKTKQGNGVSSLFPFKMPSGKPLPRLLAPDKYTSPFPLKCSVMLTNAIKPVLSKQKPNCHLWQFPLHLLPFIHHQDRHGGPIANLISHSRLLTPYCYSLVLTLILSQLDRAVLIGLSASCLTHFSISIVYINISLCFSFFLSPTGQKHNYI